MGQKYIFYGEKITVLELSSKRTLFWSGDDVFVVISTLSAILLSLYVFFYIHEVTEFKKLVQSNDEWCMNVSLNFAILLLLFSS